MVNLYIISPISKYIAVYILDNISESEYGLTSNMSMIAEGYCSGEGAVYSGRDERWTKQAGASSLLPSPIGREVEEAASDGMARIVIQIKSAESDALHS